MGRFRVEHLVPAAAALVLLLVATGPAGAGSPAAGWVAFGLLVAPALMVYVHRWAAAGAAVACAAGWVALGLGYLAPCAYAVVALVVARHHRAPPSVPDPGGRRPPDPGQRLPAVAAPAAALGTALLAASAVAGILAPPDQPALLAPVIAGLGMGVALLARAGQRRRGLRALFASTQPVRPVRVVDQLGYLHVLVPAGDGRTAVEFGVNTGDTWSTPDSGGDPRTRPAVLYGEPRTGAWCAVEVDGRMHVPVEPVGATTEVPYDADHGLPREVSDDEDQLVDPAALTGEDRRAGVHEHRIAPVRAWATTAVVGLGAALGVAELADLAGWSGTWPAVALVAAGSAAGYEFGWRSQIRPRLRWHAGGIAAVGFRARVREPWTVDSAAVHDDEGAVTLIAGGSVLTVAAPRPWPGRAGQRDVDELVAALRAARTSAFAGGDLPPPPTVEVPRRPLLWWAAWAVTAAGAVALFGQ